MIKGMTEVERAILQIKVDISEIRASIGPRIGEAELCRYHSEQLERLGSKINIWTGGIAVISFIIGVIVPIVLKYKP